MEEEVAGRTALQLQQEQQQQQQPASSPAPPSGVPALLQVRTNKINRLDISKDFLTCHYFFVNQEIMDVEHLWFSSSRAAAAGSAGAGARAPDANANEATAAAAAAAASSSAAEGEDGDNNNPQNLTVMADKRLYKLVKWCKSLPLFKNILVSLDWRSRKRPPVSLFARCATSCACLSLCVRRRKSHTFFAPSIPTRLHSYWWRPLFLGVAS